MNRSVTTAVLLVVLALGVAAAWRAVHRVDEIGVVELDAAPRGPSPAPVTDDGLELPVPEAPEDGAAEGAKPVSDRRRLVSPTPPDYEARYAGWTPKRLAQHVPELQALIESAKSRRFDQLHARFDELRAKHQYGARVTELGKAFEGIPVDLDHSRDVSARIVQLPDGTYVMHVLEFSRAEEPATANLIGELAWVKARLHL